MVSRPEVPAPLGTLLQMQILRLNARFTDSETGGKNKLSVILQVIQVILVHANICKLKF